MLIVKLYTTLRQYAIKRCKKEKNLCAEALMHDVEKTIDSD